MVGRVSDKSSCGFLSRQGSDDVFQVLSLMPPGRGMERGGAYMDVFRVFACRTDFSRDVSSLHASVDRRAVPIPVYAARPPFRCRSLTLLLLNRRSPVKTKPEGSRKAVCCGATFSDLRPRCLSWVFSSSCSYALPQYALCAWGCQPLRAVLDG